PVPKLLGSLPEGRRWLPPSGFCAPAFARGSSSTATLLSPFASTFPSRPSSAELLHFVGEEADDDLHIVCDLDHVHPLVDIILGLLVRLGDAEHDMLVVGARGGNGGIQSLLDDIMVECRLEAIGE